MGESNGYARPELLVETAWLAAHLDQPGVRIVDTRSREKFDAGHIPGAVWFDAATKLKDPEDRLHVPRPELFQQAMRAIGVGPDTDVIAYDDNGGNPSTRLWWVLEYYGHTSARIVNGGWTSWVREGLPVETDARTVAVGAFAPVLNPDTVCSLATIQQAAESGEYTIIDTRTAGEYAGTDVRAQRGGHVPNAVHIDWQRNVTDDDRRVWRPAAELRALYERAGVRPDKPVITYCQSAVRASHTLFTLRLLGYDQVRNYDGSWAEYGNRSDTIIAT